MHTGAHIDIYIYIYTYIYIYRLRIHIGRSSGILIDMRVSMPHVYIHTHSAIRGMNTYMFYIYV